jgi:hypothetical protein
MIQRVYIETDAKQDEVQAALGDTKVSQPQSDGEDRGHPYQFVAEVHESRDAEEEVTNALNEAGIEAYVYAD